MAGSADCAPTTGIDSVHRQWQASPITSPSFAGDLSQIRVLVADDEPELRIAIADLVSHEDHLVLVGTAGDAEEAIALAIERRPDVALVDVKMPSGGGPRAAREILRASPGTRVIALSAFEDRPTVLEMLRAGAVGYLVKGTAAEQIVESIERVANGGTSMSVEVVGGIVSELTSQLRREEIERETQAARRGQIERFITGDGVSMVFQPIVDLRTGEERGIEALARFRSFPLRPPDEWFAEAVALELSVALELRAVRQALSALPRIDARRLSGGQLLAPHRLLPRARRSPRRTRRSHGGRDHRARAGGRLPLARRGAVGLA